eukprot:GHVT01023653.1.p1 GENE.GHVT01023653.1~~GHVT01023653.1.p1  ORF type:complete len:664 (+),score=40.87 GHVT01023653.1:448-2439(+)
MAKPTKTRPRHWLVRISVWAAPIAMRAITSRLAACSPILYATCSLYILVGAAAASCSLPESTIQSTATPRCKVTLPAARNSYCPRTSCALRHEPTAEGDIFMFCTQRSKKTIETQTALTRRPQASRWAQNQSSYRYRCRSSSSSGRTKPCSLDRNQSSSNIRVNNDFARCGMRVAKKIDLFTPTLSSGSWLAALPEQFQFTSSNRLNRFAAWGLCWLRIHQLSPRGLTANVSLLVFRGKSDFCWITPWTSFLPPSHRGSRLLRAHSKGVCDHVGNCRKHSLRKCWRPRLWPSLLPAATTSTHSTLLEGSAADSGLEHADENEGGIDEHEKRGHDEEKTEHLKEKKEEDEGEDQKEDDIANKAVGETAERAVLGGNHKEKNSLSSSSEESKKLCASLNRPTPLDRLSPAQSVVDYSGVLPPHIASEKRKGYSPKQWRRYLFTKANAYMAHRRDQGEMPIYEECPSHIEGLRPLTPKVPTVALVGRPNVGKSALFNRIASLTRGTGAIVHDSPGITRDRHYEMATWGGYNFRIVDTGGILFDDDKNVLVSQVKEQAMLALSEASCALVVVDGQAGLATGDEAVASFLRQQTKPLRLLVNKCESPQRGLVMAQDFWKLGLGQPVPCSGLQGTGVAEALDWCTQHISWLDESEIPQVQDICVSIVGR